MSNNQMIDSCLLVNRRVEQRQEHSVTRTEITHRRVLQESPQDIAQFTTTAPEHSQSQSIQQSSSYSVDIAYLGHSHSHAHNGHLASAATGADPPLPSDATQQVTTVTKVVREVHQMGPDGGQGGGGLAPHPHPLPQHYQHQHPHQHPHQPVDPHQMPAEQQHGRLYGDQYRPTYQDYDHYPYPDQVYPGAFPTYGERPGTPPSPSEPSDSPTATATAIAHHDFLRKGAPFPTASYDDMEPAHYRITPSPGGLADRYDQMSNPWPIEDTGEPSQLSHGMRWRDPNLTEVISFLSNPNDVIKANAAAYLQHLCYMDDPNKQKTRSLGGIPPLVRLLAHDAPDVYRNACGALRNLSYGRQNDENKRAIKNAGGIPLLMNLLKKPSDAEVKELVTGVLWNLSSCEDLKRAIIDDGLLAIVGLVIVPHSGWDPAAPGDTCWSTVFRNTTGVLRNVSSAGEYARKRLRECPGLVDALLYVVRAAIDKANIGNKSVENCVCVLRNLSYRCQEVDDPDYDKQPPPGSGRAAATRPTPPKGENSGCFGASKKKKDATAAAAAAAQQKEGAAGGARGPRGRTGGVGGGPPAGVELLWQPEVVQAYLSLLQTCSNPETLEAAAGALQNLAACYWQPSAEMRAAVRKEKGLPILVELLRMEVDRVVCAVATALRNLAIDQRNKELIGKYAMRDLVQKLPTGNPQHDQGTSDDTIAAVLATLNEVIKKNAEFSRSLLESGGVERLMNITKQRQKYTARVLKFAGQVLFTMWQHQELREVYKKHGWKEQDFVSKTAAAAAARDAGAPHSPDNANNTLNRPMASQGGTRYEDRTVQRPRPPHPHTDNDEIPLADMSYPEGSSHAPGPRTVKPGEPLYAQVNREKKKNRGGAAAAAGGGLQDGAGGGAPGPADLWGYDEAKALVVDGGGGPPPGGDSWV